MTILKYISVLKFIYLYLKGHAAPILYAAWAEAGLIPVSQLKTLRKIDSNLDGHPTPVSYFSFFNF